MVDLFMDAGFTYFDTARGYHNGRSEAALREAVVERYPRESFQVATKLPAWLAKNADHARAMFDKSLRETGAGYFDFFLLHNLGEERTRLFDDFGLWDFLHEKKEAGLIRNLGFSIHDKAAVLEEVLEAHPEVDFVQLQINYADWESETVESRKCYEAARAHGLPVVVMDPLRRLARASARGGGGRAARREPGRVAALVGAAVRRVAAGRAHRAVRHVHARSGEREHADHALVPSADARGGRGAGARAGHPRRRAHRAVHRLPLLFEELPEGRAHPGGSRRSTS